MAQPVLYALINVTDMEPERSSIMKMPGMLMSVAVAVSLLAPVYAAAATEPSQECKDCVMKCVMEKNKEGRDCLRVHPAAPSCECDTLCSGVDRKALMQKLRDEARQRCSRQYDTCIQEAGGDAMKQNICSLNRGVCQQQVLKMF